MVQCLVTGKTTEPYLIPKTVRVECSESETCKSCAVPGTEIDITADNENILPFIDTKQSQFMSIFKSIVKRQCKTLRFEILEVQNVERIFISQPTGRFRERHTTTHIAYYVGYGIDANYNYDFNGVPTIDPTSQVVTVVFDKAKKLKTDIESFKLSKQTHEQLKQFQIQDATPEKIFEKLHDLYNVYAHNITQIYHREDLHMAIDLALRTVISFKFANEYVHKGWADIIVIGDGRTGKGFVAEKLSQYFNVGEVASADNCSYAGLVAGLEQYRGHWAVSWGRIPLNDLGALIIDEASELAESWGKLDRIRSEGVAAIDKIIKQVTNARTRIISLANPKRRIAQYSYGVQSIFDVMHAHENIARLDYALVVADTEVSTEEVNKIREPLAEIHDRDAEQNLVLWTWSRQTDEVKFTSSAIDAIYSQSNKIAQHYVSDIPLIQGANVRFKIAKIAVAFAARFYSCDEEGAILLVEEVHVICAVIFLNMIYKKASSGYYTMSQLSKSLSSNIDENDVKAVDTYLSTFVKDKAELCKCLISNNVLTARDIAEHLNFSNEIATEVISKLLKHNMLTKKFQNTYVKTKPFTDWLKKQVLMANKMEETE